ncbi:hypothetical protein [Alcanivorax sp. NBRC 102028]|uniref:hypothetical protein n=1 Tax=Alcanivorax sp. NBRC 102028 TaxID=1113897 RepID=UPI000789C87F|nr:hypothetical protein [Alcanivorax sp. NBRC 102028]
MKKIIFLSVLLGLPGISASADVGEFRIECDWKGGNPFEKSGRAVFEYKKNEGEGGFFVDHGFFEHRAKGVVNYELVHIYVDRHDILNAYYNKTFPTTLGFGKEVRMFRLIYRLSDREITVRNATLNEGRDRVVSAHEHGSGFTPSDKTTQYKNCISVGL